MGEPVSVLRLPCRSYITKAYDEDVIPKVKHKNPKIKMKEYQVQRVFKGHIVDTLFITLTNQLINIALNKDNIPTTF